jgi:hypothetical protein
MINLLIDTVGFLLVACSLVNAINFQTGSGKANPGTGET